MFQRLCICTPDVSYPSGSDSHSRRPLPARDRAPPLPPVIPPRRRWRRRPPGGEVVVAEAAARVMACGARPDDLTDALQTGASPPLSPFIPPLNKGGGWPSWQLHHPPATEGDPPWGPTKSSGPKRTALLEAKDHPLGGWVQRFPAHSLVGRRRLDPPCPG